MVNQHIETHGLGILLFSELTLGPSFKVKLGYPNLKALISLLLLFYTFEMVNKHVGNHWLGIFWCGRIWLWASLCYAAAIRREIFGVNALRGKWQQLGSPNLQNIFIGVSFSGKEISLILTNKMATTGISLKIIYIFLLSVSHRWKVESLHRWHV